MGLDMYLSKVKRIDNVTPEDFSRIDDYWNWCLRGEKYRDCDMKEWCGVDLSKIDLDLAAKYFDEYIRRYSTWDTEKKYGFYTVEEPVGYWRKANHIHNWFVENVQDGIDECQPTEVTAEQLEDLLDICKRVKEASKMVDGKVWNGTTYSLEGVVENWDDGKIIEDPSVAEELLPTADGFFFGSTEYDQYYMEGIDHTIEVLEKVLNETDFSEYMIIYQASW